MKKKRQTGSLRPDLEGTAWRRLRLSILIRDSYVCWICKGQATQVDHLKPHCAGGTNHPGNLAAICGPCNNRKHDRWNDTPIITINW